MKTQAEYIRKLPENLFLENVEILPNDVLMVIDMQNDFVDRPYSEKGKRHKSGKLPTHNAKRIIKPIVKMINKFKKTDDVHIIATRDYHPKNQCSFPIFGEHCVMGSKGSDVVSEIEKTLVKGKSFRKNCNIVYKADNKSIDSFGAFPYTKKLGMNRICGCTKKKCPTQFTGAWGLKNYSKYPKMKTPKKIPMKRLLKNVSKKDNYVFICGVLGDFCVLDTARNARAAGYKNVVIIIDLIRSLRIKEKTKVIYPTSPAAFAKEARKHKFYFVLSGDIN